eukprot:CAMPEP_0196718132 /NCGR_PEP_ID=MMETSP1091-20130531/1410_1 /TAXON_ID=302021 /ORGANISM="Rhodomonas sp., Strain CCMP768" /LENGTH=595 /DNA_ID=CAMNT_0042058723 /DNA_START=18 /DNA_END=1805 /DNA_ORIENTATION=+
MQRKILSSCTPEYNLVPNDKTKLTFNVHLRAPEVQDEDGKRPTVALSAVIDTSGSMEGSKLQLVKESCNFILDQMSAKDKLGLVEYNTVCREVFALSRASEGFKPEASRLIKRLKAESRTNLSGGLFLGFEQQQKNKYLDWEPEEDEDKLKQEETPRQAEEADGISEQSSFVEVNMRDDDSFSEASMVEAPAEDKATDPTLCPPPPQPKRTAVSQLAAMKRARFAPAPLHQGRTPQPPAGLSAGLFAGRAAPNETRLEEEAVRSIFLFTDGLANEGLTRQDKLVDTLTRLLASTTPPPRVCTFGFGEDHSAELLGELAKAGAGTYYFIDKEEGIATAFADALGGLLSVAAQNVTLEFQPAEGVQTGAVHTPFATTRTGAGAVTVAVGDLFSEEGKDVLFDVELPPVPADGCQDYCVGTLRLSYLDVEGCVLASELLPCQVRRLHAAPAAPPDAKVAVQRARVETAAAMVKAEAAAASGNRAEAAQSLKGAMAALSLVEAQAGLAQADAELMAQLRWDCEEAAQNVATAEAYSGRGGKVLQAKMRAHAQQRTCALEDMDYLAAGAPVSRGPVTHTYATPTQLCYRGIASKKVGKSA